MLKGSTVAGQPVHLTGFDALAKDSGEDSGGPGLLLEATLGALGALAVLGFVFASFLAVVPIVMAFASIMTTFLLLLGLTQVATISPIVQFLIALLGLGVAIDYSLIVVSRWREERAHGRSGDEAVQKAMETAGRAVVFSGITVAIGLLALVALPLPFLRSMGYGGMLIPLVSRAGGDHAAAGRAGEARVAARLAAPAHRRQGEPRAGRAGPTLVARHRWVAALRRHGGRARARRGGHRASSSARPTPTPWRSRATRRTGLVALEKAGIGEGALLPHEILVERRAAIRAQVAARGAPASTASTARSRPADPQWRRDGTALVEAIPVPDSGTAEGGDTLDARARGGARGRARRAGRRRSPPRTRTSSTPSTAASR